MSHAVDHERRAHEYAAPLACERSAAEQEDAALELAADQGVALRAVIAHSASAITRALLEVADAIRPAR